MLRIYLFLFFFLLGNSSLAVFPSAFAFESVDSISTTARINLTKASLAAMYQLIDRYEANIDEIESRDGVYSSELSQEILNLANVYQQYNKHDEAIALYKKSWHLKRINEGLYAITQVQILRRLIDSLIAKKQWDKVDERYKYLTWLYTQNYAGDAIESLEITLESANWYLTSYSLKRSDDPLLDLIESFNAYSKAVNIIHQHYGEASPRLLAPLHSLMTVNYLISVAVVNDSTGFKHDTGNVLKEFDFTHSKIIAMKRKGFQTGLQLIEQELFIYQQQADLESIKIIQTLLKKADWYLIFGKRNTASDIYRSAFHYATENISDELAIQAIFALPVSLPNFPQINNTTITQTPLELNNSDSHYVLASMDVTRFGNARNIKIVHSSLENTRSRAKILRSLRDAIFRPSISDGQLTASEQVQLHIFP